MARGVKENEENKTDINYLGIYSSIYMDSLLR